MALHRFLSTLLANLSFWVTKAPISIKQLDSAESLLVKIYHIFNDLYVRQGLSYRAFCLQALKGLCSVEINERIVTQSVNKTVATYSRVYDVLIHHRDKVIAAFKRKSSFDTEAALLLLEQCEKRSLMGNKSTAPDYHDNEAYEVMAQTANDFAIFEPTITGKDLTDFRDGCLIKPLSACNVAHAVFYLSLLEKLHYLPRDWKNRAVKNKMLVDSETGKVPSHSYLKNSASRNDAGLFLSDTTSSKYFVRNSFYSRICDDVKRA